MNQKETLPPLAGGIIAFPVGEAQGNSIIPPKRTTHTPEKTIVQLPCTMIKSTSYIYNVVLVYVQTLTTVYTLGCMGLQRDYI